MTSRVVPGVGDTSAAGRLARAFSRVLFPAFGGPTSATCTNSPLQNCLDLHVPDSAEHVPDSAEHPYTSGI